MTLQSRNSRIGWEKGGQGLKIKKKKKHKMSWRAAKKQDTNGKRAVSRL